MANTSDITLWQARSALCELLALSFRYPTRVLAEAVASGEWDDAAGEIAEAVGIEWHSSNSTNNMDEEQLLHALRIESTRLFIGSPDPVVSPFEGVWRAADEGVDALLFVNPHSMEVERFCKACGLGRPEGTNEPLDYVATELELLEYLAARAALDALENAETDHAVIVESNSDNALSNTVASQDLPGGSAEAAFNQFMNLHVQTWMPRFANKVQEETDNPFFKSAALLLEQWLESMR